VRPEIAVRLAVLSGLPHGTVRRSLCVHRCRQPWTVERPDQPPPALGSEQAASGGCRQQSGANATAARLGRGMITIVPVTSTTERIYPFQVRGVPGQDRRALAGV